MLAGAGPSPAGAGSSGGRPGRTRDRAGGQRGAQAADRGVRVDVLHRHRRQVGALAHAGAELRHDHRVGAELVEEVRVGRHPVDAARCRPAPRQAAVASVRAPGAAVGGAGRRGARRQAAIVGAGRRPSSTPTAGRRLRTRAQNRAITSESAPRSSKKCWSAAPGRRHDPGQHLGQGSREAGLRAGAPSLDAPTARPGRWSCPQQAFSLRELLEAEVGLVSLSLDSAAGILWLHLDRNPSRPPPLGKPTTLGPSSPPTSAPWHAPSAGGPRERLRPGLSPRSCGRTARPPSAARSQAPRSAAATYVRPCRKASSARSGVGALRTASYGSRNSPFPRL